MNSKELYQTYIDQKNLMMTKTGPQSSILKPEYTRDQYLLIHNKIQIIQNAINNSYYPKHNINYISIADYWIKQIEEKGYNKYILSGKSKDIKLYNTNNNYVVIRDKIAKDFIILCIEELKLKEWIYND
jgi:hypothetical protein